MECNINSKKESSTFKTAYSEVLDWKLTLNKYDFQVQHLTFWALKYWGSIGYSTARTFLIMHNIFFLALTFLTHIIKPIKFLHFGEIGLIVSSQRSLPNLYLPPSISDMHVLRECFKNILFYRIRYSILK